MLDLESEAMRGLGSIPSRGNIYMSLDFFHIVKSLMPILALLPILSICDKPENLFRKSANFCHKQKFQEKDIDSNRSVCT